MITRSTQLDRWATRDLVRLLTTLSGCCPWPCGGGSACSGSISWSNKESIDKTWKRKKINDVVSRNAEINRFSPVFWKFQKIRVPPKVRYRWERPMYIYIYTPHIKMGQFENISYNSEFHAQKQSSGNWILKKLKKNRLLNTIWLEASGSMWEMKFDTGLVALKIWQKHLG